MSTERKWGLFVVLASAMVIALSIGVVFIAYSGQDRPAPGISQNIQEVRPAVVHVRKDGVCQGSGVILSSDGIVMTARHVTGGTHGDYTVTLDNGTELGVKYVIEDKENDVAFLWLDLPRDIKLPHVKLSDRDPKVGDFVYIGGSPFGFDNFNTFTWGMISAKDREFGGPHDWHVMMQTDSAANPGNSGGPVFNMDNEVVGVLVGGYNPTLNYSVPVARFRETIGDVRIWFALMRFKVVEDKPDPVVQYDRYGAWQPTAD